jgi:hypothetical protein
MMKRWTVFFPNSIREEERLLFLEREPVKFREIKPSIMVKMVDENEYILFT